MNEKIKKEEIKTHVVYVYHGFNGVRDYGGYVDFSNARDALDYCEKYKHPKNRYFSIKEKAKILLKELENFQSEITKIAMIEYLSLKETPTNMVIKQLLRFTNIKDEDMEKNRLYLEFLNRPNKASTERLFDFDFEKANSLFLCCFFDSQPEDIAKDLKRLRAIRDSILCYTDIYASINLTRIEFPPLNNFNK